jgi:amidase
MQSHSDVNYTCVWNGLDYPAAVFPVTTVDPAIDMKKAPHMFISEADKLLYQLCSSIVCHCAEHILTSDLDDPATFKGAPIALQLVGRTLEDEAVIGMAEIVDAAIKNF